MYNSFYIIMLFCLSILILLINGLVEAQLFYVRNKIFYENPDENGDYFEGDMILDDEQMNIVMNPNARNARVGEKYKWNNAIVYYRINFDFDMDQINQILKAIEVIENRTCIQFRPKLRNTIDYIEITGFQGGCYSSVGRRSGKQRLNLTPNMLEKGCFLLYRIVHELVHALGFYHQQSAIDRDHYVQIIDENIKEDKKTNFVKYGISIVTDFGIPYDYESLMHYGTYAFSKNGKPTILPLNPDIYIGQRIKLSESDIIKLNLMYCRRKKKRYYIH